MRGLNSWIYPCSRFSIRKLISVKIDTGLACATGLLEKSKANKDKYAKERLDDYYKRNYKDYFEFVEGFVKQGELTEAEKGMMEWLKKNR